MKRRMWLLKRLEKKKALFQRHLLKNRKRLLEEDAKKVQPLSFFLSLFLSTICKVVKYFVSAAASLPNTEESTEKKTTTRRRSRKKTDKLEDKSMSVEPSDTDELQYSIASEGQQELDLDEHEGEDISYTYSWPPLVCCFGAAQHSFIPSGRPANRLIDHEIHERNKGMLWHPSKFVRAPGGSASSVAVALTSLGGRVAFMGKLGDDEYGQSMLYHLNLHGVQTRSIKLDEEIATAVSHMKISRRGDLKMTCVKPCAEDSFLAKEINVDVLKEVKFIGSIINCVLMIFCSHVNK